MAAAQEVPRFGYHRMPAWRALGESRVRRMWRALQLNIPRRRPRRRRCGNDIRLPGATQPNSVWSYDFVHDQLVRDAAIDPAFIAPSSPWQNGCVESLNGKLRDELLNREWLSSRAEAKVLIERWRQFYNERRPHSARRYQPPATVRRAWLDSDSIDTRLTA